MKNVLITGGAGFLGSHLTDRAIKEGCSVWVMDNLHTGQLENIAHHEGSPRFRFVDHDVRFPFPAEVQKVKFDLIFHLACPASPVHYQSDPIYTMMTCVLGTDNSMKEALRCGCPVMIASTSEVYGDPNVHPQPESYWGNVNCTGVRSCYDEGKRAAEALAFDYHRKHGVKIRVPRIFNTYGPRMCFNDGRIISNFVVQALRGEDMTVYGTGSATRSFQYVDDLIEGFWRLIHSAEPNPVNLGNPEEYTVLQIATVIRDTLASKSKIIHLPALSDDPQQRRPDNTRAHQILGWHPKITVTEGLARTIKDFSDRLMRGTQRLKHLYVQCNPLLDISAHVDGNFLAKYNLKPASAALAEPVQMGIYDELEKATDVKLIPGGSGLNTARVAQWMAQAPSGDFVSYVGCISDDKRGQILKQSAEAEGVAMCVQYSATPTGSCAVCIVGKERSLLANLGASNDLQLAHLETPRAVAAIKAAELYYITGFALSRPIEPVLKIATHSLRTQGTMLLNLSAPFIIQVFGAQLNQVMPFVDVLFGNEDEARAFASSHGMNGHALGAIAAAAAALPKNSNRPRLVVFTHGKESTVWATGDGKQGEVAVAPIDSSKVVDTNGAGDAFVGGFAAALARGRSIEQCIVAGHYAAGVIIQHDGCTFPSKPAEW